MNALKACIVQFALWLSYSWPFVRDVLWEVLRDGRINVYEVQAQLELAWPRDENGQPKDILLPWATKFRTEDSADDSV